MMYGWVIGIILVVVLIVALGKGGIFQRNTGATDDGNTNNNSAMETLKNRYAKGEIDKAEFEERKTELEKTK
ncbi:SHOCT domain-containing protein [Cyclobacterium sp.]|jgi:putative membrane protein|uniref:SHOCT domain-containing protein n=1 Tax=Cyclobacterium sp. TaxID=1966343 RepID=UPI0019A7D25D|nr:SHOCT domain-containing protein [Cyclobacterium sp.]MBD3627744.1 SHOCT domain-containing protein [Cyclobacterium sp.]